MYRIVDYRYTEAISYAFNKLPYHIFRMLEYTHFLTGTDPVYAGLHDHVECSYGRSYRDTAHVSYPWNALNRKQRTTVVLPVLRAANPFTVIHELGHVLDELLGFRYIAKPIDEYAKTNREEAFAQAFAAQYFWFGETGEDIFQSDIPIQRLFGELAESGLLHPS